MVTVIGLESAKTGATISKVLAIAKSRESFRTRMKSSVDYRCLSVKPPAELNSITTLWNTMVRWSLESVLGRRGRIPPHTAPEAREANKTTSCRTLSKVSELPRKQASTEARSMQNRHTDRGNLGFLNRFTANNDSYPLTHTQPVLFPRFPPFHCETKQLFATRVKVCRSSVSV